MLELRWAEDGHERVFHQVLTWAGERIVHIQDCRDVSSARRLAGLPPAA